jgi:metallo-beta-lactamase family protein
MKLTVWGAAQQVTGSKHLLELPGGTRVLVDCGLDYDKRSEFEERNSRFPFDPKSIDLLILTHAHIDHSGNVPNLIRQGFSGKILCTPPTLELSDYLLQDSLNIQRMEIAAKMKALKRKHNKKVKHYGGSEPQPLYARKHIADMLDMALLMEYGHKYEFNEELSVEFLQAGHILGAGSAVLHVKTPEGVKTIGFTGDLGNYQSKLVPDPVPMPQPDYIISESTYGGRNHVVSPMRAEEELLKHVQETCVEKGGKLVIPAFSVGRTQAIIFTLNQLFRSGRLPHIKVFTDSPLAIRSTSVYQHNVDHLNEEAAAFQKQYGSLFDFPLLHVVEHERESDLLSVLPEPCVIISAAGMVEGGRIQMHVRNNVGDARNTILIAGFCAEGTLGHRLLQGQNFVEINYKQRPVRADIRRTDAFSAHPDHAGLLKYLKASAGKNTRGIFLVHGDARQMEQLAADVDFSRAIIPVKGHSYNLMEM